MNMHFLSCQKGERRYLLTTQLWIVWISAANVVEIRIDYVNNIFGDKYVDGVNNFLITLKINV